MERRRAIEILKALVDGMDPYDYVGIPSDSVLRHPQTQRALVVALRDLEDAFEFYNFPHRGPTPNKGKHWTSEEDQLLTSLWDRGASISELALRLGRPREATRIRLQHHGRLPLDPLKP